jgi:GTPase KRas protein
VNNETVTLGIIDTAGQEEFQAMRFRYLLAADAFVIVFAVNDLNSMNQVLTFYHDACEAKGTSSVPCVISANKCDLPRENISVTPEMAQSKLSEIGAEVVLTSAKTGLGINDLFQKAVKILMKGSDGGKSSSKDSKSKKGKKEKKEKKSKKSKKEKKDNKDCFTA